MFATAVDRLLQSNPSRGVRIPGSPGDQEPEQDEGKALTRVELAALLDAIPSDWRPFFEFLAHTGLRNSEAVGLRWEHLDLGENPKVKVREQLYEGQRKRLKGKRGRRDIPLSPKMAARLLARRRDNRQGHDGPVFASKTGTALRPNNVYRRVLVPAVQRAGLATNGDGAQARSVSFHSFRHTCASLLFEAGRNVKQVQEWLGHADPGFTLRTYVHLMDTGVGSADFLDEAVGGNQVATQGPEKPAKNQKL
jgi:integrase